MHIIRALSWKRLSSVGWDGFFTFVLSIAVVTMSGGLTFLICWTIVLKFSRLPAARTAEADVILVMGARLNRGKMTRDFQERLGKAAKYGSMRPVIVLGGMAVDDGPTEAAAGRSWLVDRGIDEKNIYLEESSRNSLENLSQAREIDAPSQFPPAAIDHQQISPCPQLHTGQWPGYFVHSVARRLSHAATACSTDTQPVRGVDDQLVLCRPRAGPGDEAFRHADANQLKSGRSG